MNTKLNPKFSVTVLLELSVEEARAIQFLSGYGDKDILQTLGQMSNRLLPGDEYAKGFISFMDSARNELRDSLSAIDRISESIKKEMR